MKKIHKLNELTYFESFIQVNYAKGFRYIDRAGEILNLYAEKNYIPKNLIGIDGLLLNKPTQDIEQLQVSGTQFWCRFVKPNNLGNCEDSFYKEYQKSHNIIQPSLITRVGWRNYFILEDLSVSELQIILSYKEILDNQSIIRTAITGSIDNFEIKIELTPLRSEKDPSNRAVLFDIDIYSTEEHDSESVISATLTKVRKILSEKTPGMINGLLQ
jgi:hypothetical protein